MRRRLTLLLAVLLLLLAGGGWLGVPLAFRRVAHDIHLGRNASRYQQATPMLLVVARPADIEDVAALFFGQAELPGPQPAVLTALRRVDYPREVALVVTGLGGSDVRVDAVLRRFGGVIVRARRIARAEGPAMVHDPYAVVAIDRSWLVGNGLAVELWDGWRKVLEVPVHVGSPAIPAVPTVTPPPRYNS